MFRLPLLHHQPAILTALWALVIAPDVRGQDLHPRVVEHQEHRKMAASSPHASKSWQFVGPVRMTGRLTDIVAHHKRPKTIYVASASGGVFKSTDEGSNWTPIFDDYGTASIGDLALAPSNPDIVWVGTGEANILRSSMAGTGIYKSIDAGKTFRHMGLPESHHIARVLVHPRNPSVVYVGVAGHEYTQNAERGVYKTTDGGESWTKVFYKNAKTAVIDLAMDPKHPDTLYAGTAPRQRYRWNDPKPGPESGIYKTTDGGSTWQPLTKGLPDFSSGEYERVGLSICASQPKTVYAVLNKVKGDRRSIGAQVYRSDDFGATWRDLEVGRRVRGTFSSYGWFFGQIRVDPGDPETAYVMGVSYVGTDDGGKSWNMRLARGHADYHAMWINPKDSKHVLVGNDGGILVSHDQLATAERPRNLPIAQAYNVAISQEKGGFWMYLSCQDNGAWRGHVDVSKNRNAIVRETWTNATGDESGRHAVDPKHPNIVYSVSRYGGRVTRTDYKTQAVDSASSRRRRQRYRTSNIHPRFDLDPKRGQWVSPLKLSTHSNERLLYGAQYVFLSDDRGDSWRRISPDLTNFHEDRQGNIAHAVIFAVCESPAEKGVIYAGTDDGNLQVTRDAGKTWKNVNTGLPEGRCVANIEACHFAKGTVFATINGKRHDDLLTYAYKSTDYGDNWQLLTEGVPGSSANVIKQDPANADLLYLGTDRGVYVSTDGGAQWQVLGSGLPTVYVHDLEIQTIEDFAVIATHGRGNYVLDIRKLRSK